MMMTACDVSKLPTTKSLEAFFIEKKNSFFLPRFCELLLYLGERNCEAVGGSAQHSEARGRRIL